MKYTIEDVIEFTKPFGYIILSTHYINANSPLDALCSKKHPIKLRFSWFKDGVRCMECSPNKRPTIESIREYATSRGFSLLSNEYSGNKKKNLILKCSKEHTWSTSWNSLDKGNGCAECFGNKKKVKAEGPKIKGKTTRHSISEVRAFYETKGFTLISTEYVNNKTKLNIKCSQGHTFTTTYSVSLKEFGCPKCSGNMKYNIEEVKLYFENNSYTLLSTEYENNRTRLDSTCPKGHSHPITFGDFKNNGHRCGTCTTRTSEGEKEILSFINEYYPLAKKVKFYDISPNCPKEYKNKELDIYIPELKLAIEYCGLYWHSETSGPKNHKQHWNKLMWCRQQDVRLITIFEDEWLNRQDQVKNLLKSVMGINNKKIGARKCIIAKLSKAEALEFNNKHHIQPLSNNSLIAFGLFFEHSLVGVITASNHHRAGRDELVLQRLCFKDGFQIAGGASKLFKKLIEYGLDNGYEKIISWSDNRISEGNVYKVLGFKLKEEYKYDYSYVLNGCNERRFSKQSRKKTKEERFTGKTETVLRAEQGYYRMWDCGKKAWLYLLGHN